MACALRSDQEGIRSMAAEYQARGNLVAEHLRGLPGVEPLLPEGGLFVRVNLHLASRLLECFKWTGLPKAGRAKHAAARLE